MHGSSFLSSLVLAFTGAALFGCTPLDTPVSSSDSTVSAGTYVVDGNMWYGQTSHAEWELTTSGTFIVSHFTWNSATQSGCYDSRSGAGTWVSEENRLTLTISPRRSYRPSCDSAWRDTTSTPSGTFSYRIRTDSTGFGWLDSTSGAWRRMYRL